MLPRFLSMMRGVRRAGVTEALHVLEGGRLSESTRGKITIVGRKGLEAHAGTIYGVPDAEYERLLGARR